MSLAECLPPLDKAAVVVIGITLEPRCNGNHNNNNHGNGIVTNNAAGNKDSNHSYDGDNDMVRDYNENWDDKIKRILNNHDNNDDDGTNTRIVIVIIMLLQC